jgi:hypothetical protein
MMTIVTTVTASITMLVIKTIVSANSLMGCIGVDWLGCHVYPHHFVAHVVAVDAD